MRSGLAEKNYNALMRGIQKDRLNHISANELRFNTKPEHEATKFRFDVRNHYKMLK